MAAKAQPAKPTLAAPSSMQPFTNQLPKIKTPKCKNQTKINYDHCQSHLQHSLKIPLKKLHETQNQKNNLNTKNYLLSIPKTSYLCCKIKIMATKRTSTSTELFDRELQMEQWPNWQ